MQKRQYSQEFKDEMVEAATQPGVILKNFARENDLNAGLLGRWKREKEQGKVSKRNQVARLTEIKPAESSGRITALRAQLAKVTKERNFAIQMLADYLKESQS